MLSFQEEKFRLACIKCIIVKTWSVHIKSRRIFKGNECLAFRWDRGPNLPWTVMRLRYVALMHGA